MTLAQTLNEINTSFAKFSKETDLMLRGIRYLESHMKNIEDISKRLTEIERTMKKLDKPEKEAKK